jgi:hypothetical protein
MQEARENGQNFKTSGSNSPPRYQMPHHMKDLERQIPYSLEKTWSQIPRVGPGGMVKFRIDRYIRVSGTLIILVRVLISHSMVI